MIRHLLFLIWNKKKAHTLLITEIWASFLVLFGISSLIIYNVSQYVEPIGFAYDNVWTMSLNNNQDTVAVAKKVQAIQQRLKGYPAVESVARMGDNTPFSNYHNSMGIAYGNVKTQVASYNTDENFANTLDIPLSAGRWYRAADSVAKYRPVIINQKAVEAMFGADNPVGKVISDHDGKTPRWRVTGVINTFKARGEFMKNEPAMFELLNDNDGSNKTMIIRVKTGTDAVFESKLVKDITSMTPGWSVDVNYLTDARESQHNTTLVPIIIFLIVSGFLLINVALGLFGVL
ncbi:MAG: macrolide transporter permease, partial [Spirosoma sp.]|nr:macrolide transporter permease [Spirosoma sp.]